MRPASRLLPTRGFKSSLSHRSPAVTDSSNNASLLLPLSTFRHVSNCSPDSADPVANARPRRIVAAPVQDNWIPPQAYLAWSTSLANSGNPLWHDDFLSKPSAQAPPPRPQAPLQQLAALTSFWTTCPVNPGDIVSNHYLVCPTSAPEPVLETEDLLAMASDEDYSAFLDKASADRSGASTFKSKESSKAAQHTRITASSTPKVLQELDVTYISDADEPFEPVSLKRTHGTGVLTTKEVTELIGARGNVQEISLGSFDPKSHYESVVKAVEDAIGRDGGVKVWKVGAGGARVEYWLLGIAEASDDVVGAKATSIES